MTNGEKYHEEHHLPLQENSTLTTNFSD